jgi:hypothetical protein
MIASDQGGVCVCSRHLGHTWPRPRPASIGAGPSTRRPGGRRGRRKARDYRCTGHTWPLGPPDEALDRPNRSGCATTDVPDILGPRRRPSSPAPVGLFITMYRTYLAGRPAFSGRSTLAILETYEACVHHDRPSILGACTHDKPDILFTMYRTYLARALTMYRTYHYR